MKKHILKFLLLMILFVTTCMCLKETTFAGGAEKAYAELSNDTLTFYYDARNGHDGGTLFDVNPNARIENDVPWDKIQYQSLIKKVVIDESFKNYSELTSTAFMFCNLKSAESITGLDYLDTSNVTNMHRMFYCCEKLKAIDIGNLDTSRVTDMTEMFKSCKALEELDLSNLDTTYVTSMKFMFDNCNNLNKLVLDGFITKNVTDMHSMFAQCYKLKSINLSSFDTTKVTDMGSMFASCIELTEINLSNFSTKNVTIMDTMFAGCMALEELDLSSFSTEGCPSILQMFSSCTSLKTIYVSNKWDSSKCTGKKVFANCTSLSGGNGTVYDSTKVDYTYARIDGGIDNPGYFYKKVEPGNIEIDTVGDVSSELVINNIEENVGMTEEEIIELNSGDEFATVLEVNETTPDEDTNNKVNELLVNEEVKKVCALDISLFLKNISNNTSRPITETRQNVEVKIDLPAELIPSPSEEVGVIRIHEGVSEILPTRYDAANGRIIFNTEKFSIYVIYLKAGSNNGGNESVDYLDPLRSTLKTLIAYNATDTMIVWEEGTALPYDVMQLIKESNVTVEFKYTYEGIDYDVLINKSNVPSEYVEWYGPLYLAGLSKNYSNTGLTVHGEYVVVPGDTLNVLSARFNTTVDELMRLNPFIKDSHWIYPGQVIKY